LSELFKEGKSYDPSVHFGNDNFLSILSIGQVAEGNQAIYTKGGTSLVAEPDTADGTNKLLAGLLVILENILIA
jgi:hypothetical protein